VEAALKLARQYQVEAGQEKRYQVIGREQAYHGATLGALAVSGNRQRREMYLPMTREFAHVGLPYCYRCAYSCDDCARKYADEVARALDGAGEQAAAFIFEPISGATLGAAVPPDGYLQQVVEICARRGVLTIADEVMTGMGRTGRNLACQHWGVAPDIVALAKGIASGYAPLGAVIAKKEVVDAIARSSAGFVHGFTYNAHPVAVAAGSAVLKIIRGQRLVAAADSTVQDGTAGAAMRRELERLRDCRSVGDVRGRGLLWGVEFVAEKSSKKPFDHGLEFSSCVAAAAARREVMVYPMQGCVDGVAGDHLLLAPPAIISPEEARWAVERLREAIEEAECSVA
jgi:adenosylmethionine-8-amino-7-oxononanoate aminotransferase